MHIFYKPPTLLTIFLKKYNDDLYAPTSKRTFIKHIIYSIENVIYLDKANLFLPLSIHLSLSPASCILIPCWMEGIGTAMDFNPSCYIDRDGTILISQNSVLGIFHWSRK
jgi:hypothetical protein